MKKYLAVGAVALMLIACGSKKNEPSASDLKRLNDNANVPTASEPEPSVLPNHTIVSGDWEIGAKENLSAGVITAGTYIISTPRDGLNCYYKVVKNFDDTLESIIVNGNIDPGVTKRLVLKKSYAGISLEGDCLAKKKE